MKEARDGLGKFDIRYLGNPSLDKIITNFIDKATRLDEVFNRNRLRNSLRMLNHVKDMLSFYLCQSWNSELSKPDDPTSQGSSNEESESSDTVNDRKKRVLKKVTPKKSDNRWTCSHCGRIFINAESYNKHQNENNLDDRVEIPKVSCMLTKKGTEKKCTSKQTLSLMYRHLAQSHGISRPATNQHLRYFESNDGGKTFSSVVFLPLNAPDPDAATFIDYDNMNSEKSSAMKRNKPSIKVNTKKDSSSEGLKTTRTVKSKERQDQEEEKGEMNRDKDREDDQDEAQDEARDEDLFSPLNLVNTEERSPAKSVQLSSKDDDSLSDISRKNSSEGSADKNTDRKRRFDPGNEDENDVPPVKMSHDEASDDSSNEAATKKYSVGCQDSFDSSNSEEEDYFDEVEESEPEFEANDISSDENQLKTPRKLTVKVSSTSPESIKEIPDLCDSDEEETDSEEFTRNRVRNKQKRYAERDVEEEEEEVKLEELPENSEVISKFTSFLKDANKSKATIDKTLGILFTLPYSFLRYMTNQDDTFRLNRLLQFQNTDQFLEIKSPMDWQMSESGETGVENPTKRRAMLKAHAPFREFVLEELESADLGTDLESLVRKDKLRSGIDRIETTLKRRKVWAELERLEKEQKSERDNLKEGLNPSNNFNVTVAVQKWFASEKFFELLNKNVSVWEKSFKSGSITPPSKTDFTGFSIFAKFIAGMYIIFLNIWISVLLRLM